MDRDEEIRLIAYQIWEQEGHPHGCEVEHWQKAEAIWQERHTEPLTQSAEDQTHAFIGSLQEALYDIRARQKAAAQKTQRPKGQSPKKAT